MIFISIVREALTEMGTSEQKPEEDTKMSGRSILSIRNNKCTVPEQKACPRHLQNSKVANMTKQRKVRGRITGSESRELMGIIG